MGEPAITSAADLPEGLASLEPLYRRVFPGPRSEGWFARKLHRQAAEAACSGIAHTGDAPTADTVFAFALAGAPPSRAPFWRTSGIGVAADRRRRGHGARVVAGMLELAKAAGAAGVETLVPPHLEAFYARLGYRTQHRDAHLCALGEAVDDAIVRSPLPDDARDLPEGRHHAWTREAWFRTPRAERRCVVTDAGIAGLSREYAGWVVHWWRTDDLLRLSSQLRKLVGRDTTLILLGHPENERAERERLVEEGWRILQRRAHVRRCFER